MSSFPSSNIAKIQLEKKAVTLNVKDPYTYASGIRSPIYCDNRQLISYPEQFEYIANAFIELINQNNIEFDILAGTATAGIPWAAFLAIKLKKPMVYVRSSAKAHGKGNQIEGAYQANQKVLVIEDLISTGGSSFAAVEALREAGLEVENCLAIFTYDMQKANDTFSNGNCNIHTLTNFSTLINTAEQIGAISQQEKECALEWNAAPSEWAVKFGFDQTLS